MIVADTSALASLASGSVLRFFLEEFDVRVTKTVVEELEDLSLGGDRTAEHADEVLTLKDSFQVCETGGEKPTSSRIDSGEGSSVVLAERVEADFLITDDLRALPELEKLLGEGKVAISPIVLRALVERGVLERENALEKLERIAENRDWLHSPIYRRARGLLEEQ
ncbi:hypothetical protein AKJ64_01685 [candidate division MSBL1 archaeon SCGC-AAA259E17]|uniref:PIN domain-containing protein n=1 Tax=candidate division MSBL1 archaeon SCGC-AAA259E17 TaxID=1698263 RepID=A0A133UFQ7_9EURY|nr:hypothetical protein AKJ64_01685 [candidate division MSBL1 archaeon SCGC-AAA259E17]